MPNFWWFLFKNIFTLTMYNQNSTDLNKFLVKFFFWNVYFYIRYLFCFQVMTKTNFTKNYKIARVAPSLSGLSPSLGLETKPLAGVQGAEPWKLLGFRHVKDQNQHFEPSPPHSFSDYFVLCVLLFFCRPLLFSGSGAPVLPWISKPCIWFPRVVSTLRLPGFCL